jgi:dihydroanticapsin dehydrogenase
LTKKRLIEKTALVTGAGAGIGGATALLFASEGAKVAVHFNNNKEGAENIVRSIKEAGGEAFSVKADISSAQQVKKMVEEVMEAFKKIDILVNNSGIGTTESPDTAVDITERDWDRVIDVNLKGTLLTSKYVLKEMIKQKRGSIVNVSSIRGLLGNPVLASYCASKGGIVLLTKQTAVDYAKYNIRVNSVCPGFTSTEMFEFYLSKQEDPEEARRIFSEMAPLNRIGKPEEIASAILFFASDLSSFITGAALPVDGGYIANGARKVL